MPCRAVLALFLLFALVAAGAAAAQSAAPPRGERTGRSILITVDDLPLALGGLHPRPAERRRITRALLGTLARHRVPAVGFVVWDYVRGPADRRLLERWLAAGHELGNHTYSHPGYLQTPRDAFLDDAERGRAGLAAFLAPRGRRVRFFRFPYLLEGETPDKLDAMRAYLAESGQRNVPATIAFEDWKYEEPWVAARRRGDRAGLRDLGASYQAAFARQLARSEELSRRLFGRDVPQVLMLHANEVGAAQWPALLAYLQRQGYRFARADEVLADPGYAEPHRFIAKEGPILWERLAEERRAGEVAR
jgi:peptidoglycan/xylan/chitin deacetylase (PgdA/CDA1 family)